MFVSPGTRAGRGRKVIGKSVSGPGCAFITAGLSLPLSGTLTDETALNYPFTITGWVITGDLAGSASIAISTSTLAAYDTMTTLFTATCTSAKTAHGNVSPIIIPRLSIVRFTGSGFSTFTRCNIVLLGTSP